MGFEFSDKRIHLELCGKHFAVEAAGASVWLKDSIRVLDGAYSVLASAKDGAPLSEADIESVLSDFVCIFDSLLGGGATAEIFGERPISFYDCYELYNYIVGEIRIFLTKIRMAAETASPFGTVGGGLGK